jgi:HEAT repeat protein
LVVAKLERTNKFEALQTILTNKQEKKWRRVDAARALGKLGDSAAVIPLLQALQDDDNHLQVAAAEALGTLGDIQALDPLLQTLQDENRAVRRAATLALGKLGDARTVPSLVKALQDPDWEVQNNAARALEAIGELAVVPLFQTLNDKSKYLRRAAVRILGTIGDIRAVEPLTKVLQDEDPEMQIVVKEALAKIERKYR